MSATRAIACILLTAQALWVVSASLWIVALDDRAHNELPANSVLDETEAESEEDRLKLVELESLHGLVEAACVRHAPLFSSERTSDDVHVSEQVVLDLRGSRAPPSHAERLA